MQKVLRALDRPGHQLWEKHNVKSINSEAPLGLLMSPKYFDHIAQALKGVKGEPDRQYDVHRPHRVMPAKLAEYKCKVPIKKIKIFERKKHCASGDNTYQQVGLTPSP